MFLQKRNFGADYKNGKVKGVKKETEAGERCTESVQEQSAFQSLFMRGIFRKPFVKNKKYTRTFPSQTSIIFHRENRKAQRTLIKIHKIRCETINKIRWKYWGFIFEMRETVENKGNNKFIKKQN